MMNVLQPVLLLFTLFIVTHPQEHYVPANILIPSLNMSTVQILHNTTLNNTTLRNHTGFNNPLLNKTGHGNFNQTNSNGDLIVGRIHAMDRRIFRQVYWGSRKWYSGREKIIKYPRDLPGYYGRHETISAIRAFNQFYDGLNAKAEILAGGVGYSEHFYEEILRMKTLPRKVESCDDGQLLLDIKDKIHIQGGPSYTILAKNHISNHFRNLHLAVNNLQ